MSLAEAGAVSTLSYRGDGFKRCKQGNQKRLEEMSAEGRVRVLLESNVLEFAADAVQLKLSDGTVESLPNHNAFVLIGADTPVTWLEANNVRFVEREHLYALGSTEDVVRALVPDATECPSSPEEALAQLLGRKSKPQHRRLQSLVGHIQDEFHDVVTSVSMMFKLPDADEPPITRTDVRKHGKKLPPVKRRAATPDPGECADAQESHGANAHAGQASRRPQPVRRRTHREQRHELHRDAQAQALVDR
jgi:hypothetical protein